MTLNGNFLQLIAQFIPLGKTVLIRKQLRTQVQLKGQIRFNLQAEAAKSCRAQYI